MGRVLNWVALKFETRPSLCASASRPVQAHDLSRQPIIGHKRGRLLLYSRPEA